MDSSASTQPVSDDGLQPIYSSPENIRSDNEVVNPPPPVEEQLDAAEPYFQYKHCFYNHATKKFDYKICYVTAGQLRRGKKYDRPPYLIRRTPKKIEVIKQDAAIMKLSPKRLEKLFKPVSGGTAVESTRREAASLPVVEDNESIYQTDEDDVGDDASTIAVFSSPLKTNEDRATMTSPMKMSSSSMPTTDEGSVTALAAERVYGILTNKNNVFNIIKTSTTEEKLDNQRTRIALEIVIAEN
jgi:hypothetical protein